MHHQRMSKEFLDEQLATRHLVAATTYEEALLIARALDAYAGFLTSVNRDFPAPEIRALADKAGVLSERFHEANAARDSIEQQR